ncbi:MAG: HEAT repeat domain-containing protein, partial [bacterium]|nr:HEAT repeat domain-containing protein [bacterium]
MLVADSYHQPEFGHTGGGFNVIWRGLGSIHVPAAKDANRQRQMNALTWYYDLCRQFGGGFEILPTPPDNARYSNPGLSWGCGAIGLTYTAPLATLRITGAPKTVHSVADTPPPFTWGTAADLEFLGVDHASGFGIEDQDPEEIYDWLIGDLKGGVSVSYCEKYLRHYSPMVRSWAARRLKEINSSSARTALANAVSHSDPRVRRAVYDALSGYDNWSRPL